MSFSKEELTAASEALGVLVGKRMRLDCGHRVTLGHNLANTMIVRSEGGGKLSTECHECGY